MKRIVITMLLLIFVATLITAQQTAFTKEQIIEITSEWKGERLPDGRPLVSDDLLTRLKNISLEEAWGTLRNKGYNNQFEGNWPIIKPDEPIAGRALTVQYLPNRPDYDSKIRAIG